MSLDHPKRVDAATTRDGWTILTIHHFEDWTPLPLRVEQLREKLGTYERFITTPQYLMRFSERPVRIELSTASEVPETIRRICQSWSVTILEPSRQN